MPSTRLSLSAQPLRSPSQHAGTRRLQAVDFTTATEFPSEFTDEDLSLWREHVPQIETVTIASSADGEQQRALFFDSGSERDKPLLVVLHSWSAGYRQNIDVPYAVWSAANDWVFIHPDHRGPYDRPESTGSELAAQDILDAVDYARASARVDEGRVYLTGYSGGGFMALNMAGRHPERWTAVVAYTPIFDLVDWYAYNRERGRKYADEIAASCGGEPREGTTAHAECRRRSPSSVLDTVGNAPRIYISTGIADDLVEPSHAVWAFNELSRPEDRIADDHISFIAAHSALPPRLRGEENRGRLARLYREAGTPMLFRRDSGNVTLVLFDGGHDLVYNPGLHWLAQHRR